MRVLFLALEDFRAADRGSRIRDRYNVEALAALGDVTVMTFTPGPAIDATWDVESIEFLIDEPTGIPISMIRAGLHGSMFHVERYNFAVHKDAATVRTKEFDLVVASQMYPMTYLGQLVGPPDARPPVLWDTHNFDADVWDTRTHVGSLSQRLFARAMRPRAAALVARSVDAADGIVACTEADRDAWRSISGETPVAIVPNAVDIDVWARCRETDGQGDTFVVFGSLNQDSTRTGALWFLDNVWPAYLEHHSAASLVVAGREPGKHLVSRVRAAPHAELVANPRDLISVVSRAGTVVVPQMWGTGSKLKTIEALASGRRLVASPSAMVGLPGELGEFVDIVDSVKSWLAAMENASSHPRGAEDTGRLVGVLLKTVSRDESKRLFIDAANAVASG